MRTEVLNVDHFVEVNTLPQVISSLFFEGDGSPSIGGLFDPALFGRPGSDERRARWGYIDLGGRYLHPLIYKTACQLLRKFPAVIGCQVYVRVTKSGALQVVPEGEESTGFTGLDSLYDHWSEINWGKRANDEEDDGPVGQRAERVALMHAVPKKLAFVTKWPVMPALYRDVETTSTGGTKEVPPINGLYAKLMVSAPTMISGLSFADGGRKLRAQEILMELHRTELEPLAGKKGLIQDRMLGKYNDWSVKSVLSGPSLGKANHPSEQEVKFGELGVPLYLMINIFQPFIIRTLGEFLRPFVEGGERLLVSREADGPVKYFELPVDAKATIGPELYTKWIAKFMRSQDSRLEPLSVASRGKAVNIPLFDRFLGRPTTLLDLFFIAAMKVNTDKYIMFTRYPVEDFRACHFAKASIITTEKTEAREVNGITYDRYPVITGQIRWLDATRYHNAYTGAAGADFDGKNF